MADETLETNIRLTGTDESAAVWRAVSASLKSVEKGAQDVATAFARSFKDAQKSAEDLRDKTDAAAKSTTRSFREADDSVERFFKRFASAAVIEEFVRRSYTAYAELGRSMERIQFTSGATANQIKELQGTFDDLAKSTGRSLNQLANDFQSFMADSGASLEVTKKAFKEVEEFSVLTGASVESSSKLVSTAMHNLGLEGEELSKVMTVWGSEMPPKMLEAWSVVAPRLTETMRSIGFTGGQTGIQLGRMFADSERAMGSARLAAAGMTGVVGQMTSLNSTVGKMALSIRNQFGPDQGQEWINATAKMLAQLGAFDKKDPATALAVRSHVGLSDPTLARAWQVILDNLDKQEKGIDKVSDAERRARDIREKTSKDSQQAIIALTAAYESFGMSVSRILQRLGADKALTAITDQINALTEALDKINKGDWKGARELILNPPSDNPLIKTPDSTRTSELGFHQLGQPDAPARRRYMFRRDQLRTQHGAGPAVGSQGEWGGPPSGAVPPEGWFSRHFNPRNQRGTQPQRAGETAESYRDMSQFGSHANWEQFERGARASINIEDVRPGVGGGPNAGIYGPGGSQPYDPAIKHTLGPGGGTDADWVQAIQLGLGIYSGGASWLSSIYRGFGAGSAGGRVSMPGLGGVRPFPQMTAPGVWQRPHSLFEDAIGKGQIPGLGTMPGTMEDKGTKENTDATVSNTTSINRLTAILRGPAGRGIFYTGSGGGLGGPGGGAPSGGGGGPYGGAYSPGGPGYGTYSDSGGPTFRPGLSPGGAGPSGARVAGGGGDSGQSPGALGGNVIGGGPIGVGAGAGGPVDKQSLYRANVERFRNSPLNGLVPADGAKYGIHTGSPEEWARLSVALAEQESGSRAAPGPEAGHTGTAGLYQFEGKDLAAYGVQGAVTDPKAQAEAMARQWERSIPKAGSIAGRDARGNWTGAAAYFGPFRRPNEVLKHMGMAEGVARGAGAVPTGGGTSGGGAGVAQGPDPGAGGAGYGSGTVSVEGSDQLFHWGGGGARGRGHLPSGSYELHIPPVQMGTGTSWGDIGPKGQGYGALATVNMPGGSSGNAPGGPGIQIHANSSDQLDHLYTLGCFSIPRSEWPAFKAAVLADARQNGALTLRVGKDGKARIGSSRVDETHRVGGPKGVRSRGHEVSGAAAHHITGGGDGGGHFGGGGATDSTGTVPSSIPSDYREHSAHLDTEAIAHAATQRLAGDGLAESILFHRRARAAREREHRDFRYTTEQERRIYAGNVDHGLM